MSPLWGLKAETLRVASLPNYFGIAAAGASFRENSAVLLRYQIVAPLMMTASRTINVSSIPKQDFIGVEKG